VEKKQEELLEPKMETKDFRNRRAVLIIDDSMTVRKYLSMNIERMNMFDSIYEANDGEQGLRLLGEHSVDLVICDVTMPKIDGYEFLGRIKAEPKLADLPVIMLTGKETVEEKIRGLDLGASDYLTKPCDAGELTARIKVQLKIKDLQDKLKRANEELQIIAITDPLTDLFNRRHFMEMFPKEFVRAKRYKTNLSLCMLDIDHFKKINDTFGHVQGDEVLVQLSAILCEELRCCDFIARYGGEEFVLILPQTPIEGALVATERIRVSIMNHAFGVLHAQQVTASFGIAGFPAPGIETAEQLLAGADKALYLAKERGRNRVETCGPM
jgi:two-component system, cell cycle response regulator